MMSCSLVLVVLVLWGGVVHWYWLFWCCGDELFIGIGKSILVVLVGLLAVGRPGTGDTGGYVCLKDEMVLLVEWKKGGGYGCSEMCARCLQVVDVNASMSTRQCHVYFSFACVCRCGQYIRGVIGDHAPTESPPKSTHTCGYFIGLHDHFNHNTCQSEFSAPQENHFQGPLGFIYGHDTNAVFTVHQCKVISHSELQ